MVKKILLLLAFTAIAYTSHAQKVIDKMVKQTCECMETIDVKGNEQYIDSSFSNCFTQALISNHEELAKKYKMEFGDELMTQIQPVFVNQLLAKCPKAMEVAVLVGQANESKTKDSTAVTKKKVVLDPHAAPPTSQQCQALHLGTFQYIMNGIPDTTKILEFTKDKILDYDGKGKLITTSLVEWKTDCSYVSTMVKSESEEMKMFVNEKIKLDAVIVQIEGNIITYNVKVFGVETLFQLKKIK